MYAKFCYRFMNTPNAVLISDMSYEQMNHLTLMELGTVRNLLSESMDHIQLLRSSVGSVAGSNDSQSQD